MKTIITCLFIFAINGCATQQPAQLASTQYSNQNKELVKSGAMKWSDYYKGLYDAISKDNLATNGEVMLVMNDLINAALKFESSKITADEFDNEKRIGRAKIAKIDSDYMIKMQQIQASRPAPEPYVYRPYIQRSQPLPRPIPRTQQTNCQTYGNQTSCTTY